MTSKVAVIIPTFNRGHLIAETISSLLSQTRRPDVIQVFDDGSTDNTVQVLSEFGSEIEVVSKENEGKAATLNRALRTISADYIWICDDDDILEPEACRLLSAQLDETTELMFAAGRHMDFVLAADGVQKQIRQPGYWRPSCPDEIFPDLLEGCHIFQPGLMVRKDAYDEIGPFNEGLVRSQDYEMILRLARRFPGVVLSDLVFLHREHDGQRGSANAQFSASQNSEKWARYNRVFFEPLLDQLDDDQFFSAETWEDMPEPTRARCVLLKKACVSARQRIWDRAVEYWRAAAAASEQDLTDLEKELIGRSLNSSLGADELLTQRALREDIKAIGKLSATGASIVSLLKRNSRWMVKQTVKDGRFTEALGAVRFQLP